MCLTASYSHAPLQVHGPGTAATCTPAVTARTVFTRCFRCITPQASRCTATWPRTEAAGRWVTGRRTEPGVGCAHVHNAAPRRSVAPGLNASFKVSSALPAIRMIIENLQEQNISERGTVEFNKSQTTDVASNRIVGFDNADPSLDGNIPDSPNQVESQRVTEGKELSVPTSRSY